MKKNEIKTEMFISQTKYTYLRDPKNKRRVLTIGRQLMGAYDKKIVQWVYCINNPVDLFQKKMAHTIIEGRLTKDKTFISSFGETRPIHHIVVSLANNTFNKDPLAARIAQAHLPRFEEVSKAKLEAQKEVVLKEKKKTTLKSTPRPPSTRAKPTLKKEKQG